MIIESVKAYVMYLTRDDFSLFHSICYDIDYKCSYTSYDNWKVFLTEDMLNDAQCLLNEEKDYQLNMKHNKESSNKIQNLLLEIRHQLA